MATSLATSLAVTLKGTYTTTDASQGTPTSVITKAITTALSNGTGLGKAQSIFSISQATSDAGTTIDVFGGITDDFGTVLSMDQIKGVLLVNTSVVTGEYVDVFGSAQHLLYITGATDEIRLFPGGILLMWSPGAAADSPTAAVGTADEILLTAAVGETPTVDIIIIGENN